MTTEPPQWHVKDWQTAEMLAAAWLRSWGYVDAKVTRGGADGGLDVVSGRAVAQVKFEASAVGRPTLQRLVGANAHRGAAMYFFTGAGYSRAAVEYADQVGIVLCTYDLAGRVGFAGRWRPPPSAVVERPKSRATAEWALPQGLLTDVQKRLGGFRGPGFVAGAMMILGFGVALVGLAEVARSLSGGSTADFVANVLAFLFAVAVGLGGVFVWVYKNWSR